MNYAWAFVKNTLVGGLLVVVPIYLAVLLLLKAMKSVAAWYGHWRSYSRPGSPLKISSHCSWC